MKMQRKYLWYGLGMLVVGWSVIRVFRSESIAVEVARATVGPLMVTVGDEGQTRVRHRHVITAPVPGRLERIELEVGDGIKAGEVVARLAPLPLDARSRRQAEAGLAASRDLARMSQAAMEEARTALDQARQDRRRGEPLAAGGAIAPAEMERLQNTERARQRELEGAESRARAAAHDVEAAQSALLAAGSATGGQTLVLTCAIGGRVLAIPERSERTVQPGETLLEIGDPSDLEIVVDLLSTDAVKASPGQRMLVTGWGGESALEGRVRRVEPAGFTKVSALGVEEQRVNVVGDFVAVPGRLGDRFRLDVRLVLWEGDSVFRYPRAHSSAVATPGPSSSWKQGRAREREVTVGHESSTGPRSGRRRDAVSGHPAPDRSRSRRHAGDVSSLGPPSQRVVRSAA